jgi:hypothetical protein
MTYTRPARFRAIGSDSMEYASVALVVVANGVAASALLVAATTKLVSPIRPLEALHELAGVEPRGARLSEIRLIQFFAVIELGTGAAFLTTYSRSVAAYVSSALGVCFGVLGAAGWVQRTSIPCGCFHPGDGRSLGLRNIAIGVALVATLPLNEAVRVTDSTAYTSASALVTTSMSLLLVMLFERKALGNTIRQLGLRSRALPQGPA